MVDILIPDATSQTYTPTAEDVGHMLYCRVTGTNLVGSSSANSLPVGAIGSTPTNSVAPAITGTAQRDQILTCDPGTWEGLPTPTLAYQWKIAPSTDIVGETSNTYTVLGADVGDSILCTVTGTNPNGIWSTNSNTVGPVTDLPFVYLASASDTNSTAAALTPAAIDTTGAGLLIVAQGQGTAISDGIVALIDNKGNAWGRLTTVEGSGARSRYWWCVPHSVGPGHTITTTPAGNLQLTVTLAAFACTGVPIPDVEGGTHNTTVEITAGGGITPSENGALVLFTTSAGSYTDAVAPSTITDDFIAISSVPEIQYATNALGLAYKVQGTAALANPASSIVNPFGWSSRIMSFKLDSSPTVAAPFTLLGHSNSTVASGGSVTNNDCTSGPIDTTGATLLVVAVSQYYGTGATLTDSKGNTWTAHYNTYTDSITLLYCKPTTVGVGHTVTFTETATYPNLVFAAFSGNVHATPFDSIVAGDDRSVAVTALSTFISLTPSQNNSLLISAYSTGTGLSATINHDFTVLSIIPKNPVANNGVAMAYRVDSVRKPVDPTWTMSPAGSGTVCLAAFKHA